MIGEGISRDTRKKKSRSDTQGDWRNWGLFLSGFCILLGAATGFQWPKFLSEGIYGLFGVYTYAIFFTGFVAGISIKLSRSYAVNRRYMLCAAVMMAAALTALHMVVTRSLLTEPTVNFAEYLRHGFTVITPGGALFSVPAFVLWNVFQGLIGSCIVLGMTFIVSSAFLISLIITRSGENKVIKKKKVKPTDDIKVNAEKDYNRDYVELSKRVDERYQELLQNKSRARLDAEKSILGLGNISGRTVTTVIYDSAVPLGQLAPNPSLPDEINAMSTNAAQLFAKTLGGVQPPIYTNPLYPNQPLTQPMSQSIQPVQHSYPQPLPMQTAVQPAVSPYANSQTPYGMTPPPSVAGYGNSPQVESIFTEYELQEKKNDFTITPTSGTRRRPTPSVASGQTAFDGMPAVTRPSYQPNIYKRPGINLIRTVSTNLDDYRVDAETKKDKLNARMSELGVDASVVDYIVAPAVTRFDIVLGTGTRAEKVLGFENNFQYVLGTENTRMGNVPGKGAIGIEVPNEKVGCVSIKDILTSPEWANQRSPLAVALGKNIGDEVVIGDIVDMPHLLVAGATKSGKSVCLNTILTSLIYRADPANVKLLLVDMKQGVELSMYKGIPHMLIPHPIVNTQEVINALKWLQTEMERRYKILQTHGLKNLSQYHAMQNYQNGQLDRMPYILVVIDEAADLMHSGRREVEDAVQRLAALGRACGIHLILATQRPSVDVITSVIKANLPVRIGFHTSNRFDSQTIIDAPGCEKLVGRGDMLFLKDGNLQRVQGAYIDDEDARHIMNFIRENNPCDFDADLEDIILNGPPQQTAATSIDDGIAVRGNDPYFVPILRWLVREENVERQATVSSFQRKFALGHGRAGRIMDQLYEQGFVGENKGSKPRDVIVTKEEVDNLYGPE